MVERDGRRLFEKLALDGQQAGLSWLTILRRRPGLRAAYADFDPERLAAWGADELAARLADPRVIRHRAKIAAQVRNARAYLRLAEAGANFASFLWQFTDGLVVQTRRPARRPPATESAASRAMARALGQAGFQFAGPTICYAFMQAVGMVNDHALECFRQPQLDPRSAAPPPRRALGRRTAGG